MLLSAVIAAMVSTVAMAEIVELGVACFVEWPLPFQFAKKRGRCARSTVLRAVA